MNRILLGLFLLLFTACSTSTQLSRVTPTFYSMDTEAAPATYEAARSSEATPTNYEAQLRSVDSLVAPYQRKLNAEMNQVVGTLATPLNRFGDQPTMGYWVGDLLEVMAKRYYQDQPIAFAIQNDGGLRIPEIQAGPLTVGKIFEMMPFDNQLVILPMPGAKVQELVDRMARSGGWPSSASLAYRIEGKKGADIHINDVAFDPSATYYVAMPDYVANGGSGCAFLKEIPQINTGQFIRDVIVEYARSVTESGKKIAPRVRAVIQ